jgi:nucleotide-binding universal stress UspA family protein
LDTPVRTSLLEGPAAPTLAEHASAEKADLIVMTTHGRGAVSRFWLGSVTDELVRRTTVPLLVLRPADSAPGAVDAPVSVGRIVVPLDGSRRSESALGPAAALARLFNADLELLHVVPPLPAVAPDGSVYRHLAADAALIEEMNRGADRMLNKAADRLRANDLRVAMRVVTDVRVAAAILEETRPGDVIALATHARSPATRWLLGSVADKLIRGAEVPVLVVRPTGL